MNNKKQKIKVVIVEDNPFFNKILEKYIKTLCNSKLYPEYEFEVNTYLNAEDCIENLTGDTDIMLLDYLLVNDRGEGTLNGDQVLEEVNRSCSNCKVIMISAQQNMIVTVEMMKKGVYEYIDKNLNDNNRIGAVIQEILLHKGKYRN